MTVDATYNIYPRCTIDTDERKLVLTATGHTDLTTADEGLVASR